MKAQETSGVLCIDCGTQCAMPFHSVCADTKYTIHNSFILKKKKKGGER